MTQEAKGVASTAADRGGQLAQTAAEEVKQVADGATREARDLVQEGRAQLMTQARDGQQKAARSLHALADQLGQMSDQAAEPGVASDVTRQVSERTRSVAQWLEHREPGELLEDIRRFARRRPGVFLSGAAIAGVLVGRVTRGAVAHQKDETGDGGQSGSGRTAIGQDQSAATAVGTGETGGAALPGAVPHPAVPATPTGSGGHSAPPPDPVLPGSPRLPTPGRAE